MMAKNADGTVTTDEWFGGCPECGENDGDVRTWAGTRWCFCYAHCTRWRYQTEADFQAEREKLPGYREVLPLWRADAEAVRTRRQLYQAFEAEEQAEKAK